MIFYIKDDKNPFNPAEETRNRRWSLKDDIKNLKSNRDSIKQLNIVGRLVYLYFHQKTIIKPFSLKLKFTNFLINFNMYWTDASFGF